MKKRFRKCKKCKGKLKYLNIPFFPKQAYCKKHTRTKIKLVQVDPYSLEGIYSCKKCQDKHNKKLRCKKAWWVVNLNSPGIKYAFPTRGKIKKGNWGKVMADGIFIASLKATEYRFVKKCKGQRSFTRYGIGDLMCS